MLKTIRKYRRSVLGVVGIGLIALSMGGFGVNMASNGPKGSYAIKVGEREISFDEFAQIRRNIDARYRQMLGANYQEMIKAFNINLAQQAVDTAINNALLDSFAQSMGLEGSPQSVQQMIKSGIFQDNFDAERYSSFLASQGLNAVEFEKSLKKEIARQQLVDLLTDASKTSTREAKTMLEREKTRFSFATLKLNADDFIKSVSEPDAQKIAEYYDNNLTDFQISPSASYNYISMEASDFISKVPFTEEDIELEYTDNPSAYQTSPQIRLSQIFISVPASATAEQKEKAKKNAEDLAAKIRAGDKFEELAKIFSQDAASAIRGGDTGWISKDSLPTDVAEKAFGSETGGSLLGPIESAKGIYLIRVEDKKDSELKPLIEVKDDIIKKIQLRDAPSVAVIQAQEIFESWTSSKKSLSDFAKENGLNATKVALKLNKDTDPEPTLKDLSSNVIASKDAKQQIVEINDRHVLVEVLETTEEAVEPLDQASKKIVDILKAKAAKEAAKSKAEQILESIKKAEFANLKEASAKNSLKSEEIPDVAAASAKGLLAEPEIREIVFNYSSAPQKPTQVFTTSDGYALVELSEIKKPSQQETDSGIEGMRDGLSRDLADFTLDAFVSRLKSETKIDIQPGLLAD